MKNITEYITEAKKGSYPECINNLYDAISYDEFDEVEEKDIEDCYNYFIDLNKPAAWNNCKPLLQLLHDGELDILCDYGKRKSKEGKALDKAIDNFPSSLYNNYVLNDVLKAITTYYFNKLKPKKELEYGYSCKEYSQIWVCIQYFSDYFTDKEAEAAHKAAIDSLPSNMKEWYDKCRSFCYAGAWQYTDNPKLKPVDFKGFLEAAKEFDFTKIKGIKNSRATNMLSIINNLVRALASNNKEEILKAFDEYKSNQSGHIYWYQNDFGRDDNGGYIAEAALIIGMAKFLGAGSNYWYGSNKDTSYIEKEIKAK